MDGVAGQALGHRKADPREWQAAGRARKISEDMCASYYQNSLKCLDKNGYDKSKCNQEFEAYKSCKIREGESRLQRRQEAQKGKSK